ncbi:MAG TPA: hypothetical protein VGF84_09960 [Micromonosporaceae bacterium]
MSAPSHPKRSGRTSTLVLIRALLAIAILVPVSILFVQGWRSASATVATTKTELDGIAFMRSLQPVLTALTQDESIAVSREQVDPATINADMQAATTSDKQYGDELETHTRWADFVKAVNNLQKLGKLPPIDEYNAYAAVTNLLLDVYERIRDRSGLVRDAEPDVFYLEDAAARALPTAVVDADRFGDSIIVEFPPSVPSAIQSALLNVSTYRALLDRDSDNVGDDVSDAVDATASQTMSQPLLANVDQFRRSIESLEPTLLTPVTPSSLNDESSALQAKAAEESTATALSGALFDQISTLVIARGNKAKSTERLEVGSLVLAILLVAALIYIDIRRTSGRRPSRPGSQSRSLARDLDDNDRGGHHWGAEDSPTGGSVRERAGAPV